MKRSKRNQPRVQRDRIQYTRAEYGDWPAMVFRVSGKQRVVPIEGITVSEMFSEIPEGAWLGVVTRFDSKGIPVSCIGYIEEPIPTGLLPQQGRRTHPQAPDGNGVLGKVGKLKR